jgi:hypothetical protein
MDRHRRTWSRGVALLVTAAALSPAHAAAIQGPDAGVIPPVLAELFTGKTYGGWSAAWWRYALATPTTDPDNPLFDTTGKGCRDGQDELDPVFFLAGVLEGGAVTRDACVVPAGKALFFPLMNFVDVHVPGDGLDTPELLRADMLSAVGPTLALHASIDGVPVPDLDPATTPYTACAGGDPACAPAFSVVLPQGNVFGVAAGTYSPAVDEGNYLMVAPLAPGPHTLVFGATGTLGGNVTSQDITYHLTVR